MILFTLNGIGFSGLEFGFVILCLVIFALDQNSLACKVRVAGEFLDHAVRSTSKALNPKQPEPYIHTYIQSRLPQVAKGKH